MARILSILLLFFLFTPFLSSTFAQTPINAITSTQSLEQPEKVNEEYTLPYPGILPDSPFYILKTARDNLIGLLITNARKKAEFSLLQADKRLQAGAYLITDKKKYDLAEQTISKGENYFEEAITKYKEAKKEGEDIADLGGRLKKSNIKHISVLKDLEKKVPKDKKKIFTVLVKRVERFKRTLQSFDK